MTRKRRPATQPKYIFLTEKNNKQKGNFSDKFKDEEEYRNKPRPFDGPRIEAGSKSVMTNFSPSHPVNKRAGWYILTSIT